MNIAAVVVTYNRKALLRRCLDCLRGQQAGPLRIWVIDNASTDGTGEMVRALAWPELTYCNPGKNLGGAGGFSYGVKAAMQSGCDALWLMDDDTLPEPGALQALLQADQALQGRYGWLSSRALSADGQDQPMNRQRATPYRDIAGYGGETVPAVMASFVSLFLRAEAVRRFGLPIADFFIWSDDWEYTRRISRQLPCWVIPASRVIHAMQSPGVVNLAKDSPARWPRYRYFYRNDVVLYRREGAAGWCWLLAKDLWHSIQILGDSRGRRMQRLAILWNGFAAGLHFYPEIEYLP